MPLILGCDANAHRMDWGSTHCNTRGKSIISSNLSAENVGCEPIFVAISKREVLSLVVKQTLRSLEKSKKALQQGQTYEELRAI